MRFIDLPAQQRRIRGRIEQGLRGVLDHGRYLNGPEIERLEKKLAEYTGAPEAVACGSGTDALLLSLLALGVGPNDAVFLPPFTFVATAEVVSLIGAVPVFVDVSPDTLNIDPDGLETAVQSLTKAASPPDPKGIIAVNLFGVPADYDRLRETADRYGLFIIEDAAQSFGAAYKGVRSGVLGDIGCTSFYPTKPLCAYGDAGMCFPDSAGTADLLRSLRSHGEARDRYENVRIGINGRMDSFQAAVLLVKWDIFPEELEARRAVAERYDAALSEVPGITRLTVPPACESAHALYSVLAQDETHRAKLRKALEAAGVPTAVYYPRPLHLQGAYAASGHGPGDCPVSEDAARRIFSLPLHPYVDPADQTRVAEVLHRAGPATSMEPKNPGE